MDQEQEKSIFNFGMDEETRIQLKGVASWAKVNAIISLITMGLSILSIVVAMGVFRSGNMASDMASRQLVSWCVTLVLNILLLGAATNLQKAVDLSDQGSLQKGFGHMARYFKTIGILLIVFMVLMLLVLGFVMLIGGFGRH